VAVPVYTPPLSYWPYLYYVFYPKSKVIYKMAGSTRAVVKLVFVAVVCFIVFVVGLIYIISPVDVIPDAVPVAGWIDDLIACLPTVLSLFTGLASIIAAVMKIIGKFRKKNAESI